MFNVIGLEQAFDLAGCGIYIYTPEGGIGTGARHQADGPGAWAEELRA